MLTQDPPYKSVECHLGEHLKCQHGPPRPKSAGVIFEECTCDCHHMQRVVEQ